MRQFFPGATRLIITDSGRHFSDTGPGFPIAHTTLKTRLNQKSVHKKSVSYNIVVYFQLSYKFVGLLSRSFFLIPFTFLSKLQYNPIFEHFIARYRYLFSSISLFGTLIVKNKPLFGECRKGKRVYEYPSLIMGFCH